MFDAGSAKDREEALIYANYCAAQSCQYYGSVNAVEEMNSAVLLQPKVLEIDSCLRAEGRQLSVVGF